MRAQESTPPPDPVQIQMQGALKKMQMLASENFEDYVIIVGKGNIVWNSFNKASSAYGMISSVEQKIRQSWVCTNNGNSAEE